MPVIVHVVMIVHVVVIMHVVMIVHVVVIMHVVVIVHVVVISSRGHCYSGRLARACKGRFCRSIHVPQRNTALTSHPRAVFEFG